MGVTLSTGPTITTGSNGGMVGGNPADPNPNAGPDVAFQGSGLLDVRYTVLLGSDAQGSIKAHLDSPYPLLLDAVPAAASATAIAAAANVTNGTAMTLVSAVASGISVNVPFFVPATGGTATSAVTLDFGFDKVNVTSGSAVATVAAANVGLYSNGQWLVLAAGATPQLVQVLSGGGTTSITLSANANATNANAPVGSTNQRNSFSTAAATGADPYLSAGVAAMFNPLEALCRGVSVTGSASATGGVFKVSGYDIYGQAMTESVTVGAGAVTAYGKKAFKHIMSVTPQFTDAHNYSIGTSDLYGFNLRSDKWEYLNTYVSGSFLTASTGWTAAVLTSPATSTTGDVRGTLQVGTLGPGGSGASGGPMDGAKRLAFFMTLPLYNVINATIANPAPMYGVTQA